MILWVVLEVHQWIQDKLVEKDHHQVVAMEEAMDNKNKFVPIITYSTEVL